MEENQDLIFALDIGTRTVVGVVFKQCEDKLIIEDSEILEHEERSMLDGQIHNISRVTSQVKKIKARLEERVGSELSEVAIAAAGRALKTVKGEFEIGFENNQEITSEDVKTLEFTAVQKAQEQLMAINGEQSSAGYHFVGYSVIQSCLDGMEINNLVGQRGSEIEVEIIATFLPRVVVDSLLTVIRQADLEVEHLTLEPIAASNLLIPEQMHDFNLALVDIGAGTSDIAVTEAGAIIGYAMVPVAGDEITEAICDTYMLDYRTAERIKRDLLVKEKVEVTDILDQKAEVTTQEILLQIEDKVEELAALIADEIIDLNQKEPQAVICFGGGSLSPLLRDELARALEIPISRIGIKTEQDSDQIEGEIEELSITQGITPLGIGLSTYRNQNRANFLDVEVNGDLIHLFTLDEPKVSDALLAAEIDLEKLEPALGLALTIEVNGEVKVIPGQTGTPAKITLNGQEAELDTLIEGGAEIKVDFGQESRPGQGVVADVVPDLESKKIIANGEQIELEPSYYLDGEEVSLDTELSDRAKIEYTEVKTVGEAIQEIWDIVLSKLQEKVIRYSVNGKQKQINFSNFRVELNGEEASLQAPINSGDEISFEKLSNSIQKEFTVSDALEGVDIKSNLEIIMNGRELEVPVKDCKLLKNGLETTMDAEVEFGDELIYRPGEMTIKQVLDYINYNLSREIQEKVVVKRNGTETSLAEKVVDGDRIDISLPPK